MKLTWLGHACFLVEQDGYRIVIDPYTEVVGHADIRTEAHEVLCSHQHFDHNAVEGVALLPGKESPFTIRSVQTCHDDQGGALRGENIIHILTAGGVTVAHLGDLGHDLDDDQIEELGKLDAVLLPIGGTYTLNCQQASDLADRLQVRTVIPMHYRRGDMGFEVLQTLQEFLILRPGHQEIPGNSLEITDDMPETTIVLNVK